MLKFWKTFLQPQLITLFRLCTFSICLLNVFSYASEKVVIDTDAGGDDGVGLLMLLRSEFTRQAQPDSFKIVGITCTYGNTHEDNVEVNVLRTLHFANRSDIPVYTGSVRALIEPDFTDNFFGRDGFGEVNFPVPRNIEVNKSVHSSLALIELSKQYEGDLTIIVLGPLTNVALAIMLDEHFAKRVKSFYVSGGSIAGMANIAPNTEFNFGADPESNRIFLTAVDASQLTLLPWETALNVGLPKEWRVKVLGTIQSPYIDFINRIERISIAKENFYVRTDAMTVATYLNPKIITHTMTSEIKAELKGKLRGAITVNYLHQNSSNANIILSLDREELKLTWLRCLTLNYGVC